MTVGRGERWAVGPNGSGEALEGTLAQYPGAILFVSHDRRFVDNLAETRIDLGVGRNPSKIAP